MLSFFYKNKIGVISLLFLFFFTCCKKKDPPLVIIEEPPVNPIDTSINCSNLVFDYGDPKGCDGQFYPNPNRSKYILPIKKGSTIKMGLSNCSTSFHAAGRGDQYAYDFDMKEGVPFYAARAGIVYEIEESKNSNGGGIGNYVIINHGDNTYGQYYHSPKNGILVRIDQRIAQGEILGETGRSGLAGYPHLHFIVTKGDPETTYDGIPVTFKNNLPPDVILKTEGEYTACEN